MIINFIKQSIILDVSNIKAIALPTLISISTNVKAKKKKRPTKNLRPLNLLNSNDYTKHNNTKDQWISSTKLSSLCRGSKTDITLGTPLHYSKSSVVSRSEKSDYKTRHV